MPEWLLIAGYAVGRRLPVGVGPMRSFALGCVAGAVAFYVTEYFRPLMDWEVDLFERTATWRDSPGGGGERNG